MPSRFHHRLVRDASPVAANNVIQWFAGGKTIEHPGNFDARVLECGPSAAYTAGAHNMFAERMVSINFTVDDFVHKLAHNLPLRACKGIELLFRWLDCTMPGLHFVLQESCALQIEHPFGVSQYR